MVVISSTKLRENIYQLLDNALETGEAIEIRRNGAISSDCSGTTGLAFGGFETPLDDKRRPGKLGAH